MTKYQVETKDEIWFYVFGKTTGHGYKVVVFVGEIPICDHTQWLSLLTPCSHICVVLMTLENITKVMDVKFLHPWWYLKNHSLYDKALVCLGLTTKPISVSSTCICAVDARQIRAFSNLALL